MYKLLSVVTDQVKQHTVWDYLIGASLSEPHTGQTASPAMFIGASLSEPHTGQTASPAMFICIYVYIYVSYVIP